MTRHVAFIRGINVGRHRRVGMPALAKALREHGYDDARTFLQSGNVVLTSKAKPATLGRELERALADSFGLDVRVLVRTRDELAGILERDPFGNVATNRSRYLVSLLSAKPRPAVARELARLDVAPEQLKLIGRELYAWHPDGLQQSQLAKLLTEARLGVVATARNWNTLTKLLALADR